MQKQFLICISFVIMLRGALYPQTNPSADNISLDSLLNIKINSASKSFETSRDAPASVSIITADEIEKFGYTSFAEVLNGARGFYLSYDRNYTYLGVRGFSRPTDYNDRILITINGHSMNETYYGEAPLGTELTIPVCAISRVEIIRGPGSVVYGSNAMFAVINIVTKNTEDAEFRKVIAEVGSGKNKKLSFLLSEELESQSNLTVSGIFGDSRGNDLYFQQFDSPFENNGVSQNLDWERYYGIYSAYTFGNSVVHALFGSREKGIPTASFGTLFNNPSAKTIDTRGFLEIRHELETSKNKSMTLRAFLDGYLYKGYYPYREMNRDSNNVFWIGGEGTYRFDLSPSNRLIAGSEIKWLLNSAYVNFSGTQITNANNVRSSSFSAYAQDEAQFTDNLQLNAGIRFDKQSNLSGVLAPRIALVYSFARPLTFKYIYGEAFRYPNSYELYYTDSISKFKQSQELKQERISSHELSVEYQVSRTMQLVLGVYQNQVRDLIDQEANQADSTLQFRNIGHVQTNGAEIEANALLETGLSAFIRYSFQYSTNVETREKLTNSPSHLIKLGVSVPVFSDFRLSADFHFESFRKTIYDTRTDPFLLANINFISRLLDNKLHVSLRVANVLNKSYGYPGGYEHVQDIIMQDGRTYNLKVAYDF